MDKFKELELFEQMEIMGGQDLYWMESMDEFTGSWQFKTINAIKDVSDFFSGIGDGFLSGFNNASKYW
jgi:hypothetical protein